MPEGVAVRLLSPADADVFFALRLRACREEPHAFLEAYEEIADEVSAKRLRYFDNGWIAGAFIDDALVGISGLFRHKGTKVQHKGTVWGVYVAPAARGKGLAARLITLLMDEAARAGIELLHLSTNTQTPATIALYQKLGFEVWGTETHIMKLPDGGYVDDVLMRKFLR